jgi:hypothetical protein
MTAHLPGTDVWGKFIPLEEWALVDEYLIDNKRYPQLYRLRAGGALRDR